MDCQVLPTPTEEAQLPWGGASAWWQALCRHPASPTPSQPRPQPPPERRQEHLGPLPGESATTAATLAFLRVLIGQSAQPSGPLSPEMSWARERNCIVCRA